MLRLSRSSLFAQEIDSANHSEVLHQCFYYMSMFGKKDLQCLRTELHDIRSAVRDNPSAYKVRVDVLVWVFHEAGLFSANLLQAASERQQVRIQPSSSGTFRSNLNWEQFLPRFFLFKYLPARFFVSSGLYSSRRMTLTSNQHRVQRLTRHPGGWLAAAAASHSGCRPYQNKPWSETNCAETPFSLI